MANIIRMEDIIDIVGFDHYFNAIQLNVDDLKIGEMKIVGKDILIPFSYQDTIALSVKINKNLTLSDFQCSCKNFNSKNYCPHVALMVMYLFSHEDIPKEAIALFDNYYDPEFNDYLFHALDTRNIKTQVILEIKLKPLGNFRYELILKIGQGKHTYVLKNKLEEFIEHYEEEDYELTFGKNFVYFSNFHYFSEEDEQVLNFVQRYVESNGATKNTYYYYTSRVSSIILYGSLLKEFLSLLKNRTFSMENGYYIDQYKGIFPYTGLDTTIATKNGMLELGVNYQDLTPITEDYRYLKSLNQMYFLSLEQSRFLKALMTHRKKKVYFKEKEFGRFANVILPKVKEINQDLQLPEELASKIVLEEEKIKYYFNKKRDTIIGEIKFGIGETNVNVFSSTEQVDGKYIVRDKEKEKMYIENLNRLGFVVDHEKQIFTLEKENDVIQFLETGLKELTEKYEVYVSKNIKDIKIYPKGRVQSTFSIGKDNILSYQFSVDYVDSKELQGLLDAVKVKQKYYRLKNGNYLHIENDSELEQLRNLTEVLDLTGKDLASQSVELPKYKSIQVAGFQEQENTEFIQMNDTLQELIHKFQQYKDMEISIPVKDRKKLRDYQEIGVKWMMTIANCGFGGILADEMGLGKSFQTIEYIKLRLAQNPNAQFLIVVPTSLVYNWQKEFDKFAPEIKLLLMHDTKAKRTLKFKDWEQASVIVTSYGLLRQDLEEYQKITFDTCIIDEAQNIKNVHTENTKAVKSIRADIKFALTGTPIENSILELWSIFDYMMPGFLSNLTKFKREYSVKKIEADKELLQNLNRQISPFILRRKKRDVVKDLPEKLENTIMIELEEEQKKLYVAQLNQTKKEIDEAIQKSGFQSSQILILSLLTKLRQICVDPKLLFEDYHGESSKMKQLVEVVKGATLNGHKILLFSQFSSALQLVKSYFEQENITYYYLDGSTKSKQRMELVDRFNTDDTNVFLISLKAGGTGLNLTSADIVIHLDPWWNPQVENQATDRAHRIGQKNVVEVVKLVAKGTIEEKVVELQEKKKMLSNKIIEGENRDQIVLSKLTEKELRSLLES